MFRKKRPPTHNNAPGRTRSVVPFRGRTGVFQHVADQFGAFACLTRQQYFIRHHARAFWFRLARLSAFGFSGRRDYAPDNRRRQKHRVHPNPAPETALNGTWKFNRDQSDDAREKLRSAIQEREQNGNPGGMGRRGGMGGGGIGMGIPARPARWAAPPWAAAAILAKAPAPKTRTPNCSEVVEPPIR